MELRADKNEMKRMLEALGNERFELRAMRGSSVKRGYFKDMDTAIKAACNVNDPTGDEPYNVYVTMNEIKIDYDSSFSTSLQSGTAVKDSDIRRLRHLLIDIDSNKPAGPKVPASEQEYQGALAEKKRIKEFLAKRSWPEPVEMTSGNGCYLIYRIDLGNNETNSQLVKRALATLSNRFGSKYATVDKSVYSPGQIMRFAGSVNRKGEESTERPYRIAKVLSVPKDIEIVSEDQLRELASEEIESGKNPARFFEELALASPKDHKKRVTAVIEYLTDVDRAPVSVTETEQYTKLELPFCSRGAKHDDGRPAVFVRHNGTIGYHCFHAKCNHVSWAEFQKAMRSFYKDPIFGGSAPLAYHDPRVLAHRFLERFQASDGSYTIAHFLGDTYRFFEKTGWTRLKSSQMRAQVRGAIQTAFEEHARTHDKASLVKSVGARLVTDTWEAVQTLCLHDVAPDVQAPFWLEEQELWSPDDLLVLRNGFLDIRRHLEGEKDFLMPTTPKLFFHHRARFDYEPDAPKPDAWHGFLASLEQDEDWISCLQEIMGYCLWLTWDVQKFFMLIGPPRSGKGTIAKVLTDLLGGSVCSPNLDDFVKDFGLQSAIGKRLALVPEVTLPGKQAEDIVARLKAITGGDLVTVNRKHQEPLSIHLRLKVLMQTNDFVALPDTSGALRTRLVPLRLRKSFAGNEDTSLSKKLEAEYSGILNWALKGVKRLYANDGKFTLPESSKAELDDLQNESSPLLQFVEDCCTLEPSLAVEKKALFEIYQLWSQRQNSDSPEVKQRQFDGMLRATFPSVESVKKTCPNPTQYKIAVTDHDGSAERPYVWKGIRPKDEWCISA